MKLLLDTCPWKASSFDSRGNYFYRKILQTLESSQQFVQSVGFLYLIEGSFSLEVLIVLALFSEGFHLCRFQSPFSFVEKTFV